MNVTITLDKRRELTYNFTVDGERVGRIEYGFNGYGMWNAVFEQAPHVWSLNNVPILKTISCDTISGAYIEVMKHAGQDTSHENFWPTFDEHFAEYDKWDEED